MKENIKFVLGLATWILLAIYVPVNLFIPYVICGLTYILMEKRIK